MAREIGRRQLDSARTLADLALRQNLAPASRNAILGLRMPMARNWSEFLRFVLRSPEANLEEFEGHEAVAKTPMPSGVAPVLDWDGIDAFNIQVPLHLWLDASRNKLLPAPMQLRISEAGWLRALMLNRSAEARQFMQRIVELNPGAANVASGFLSAPNQEQARFAALYVILRTPGLRPTLPAPELRTPDLSKPRYIYTDAYGYNRSRWDYRGAEHLKPPSVAALEFLTPAQRSVAGTEWKQISSSAPWGATWLARETLAWARRYPDDKRVPEALHRAVQASYYRLTDNDTGKYSKQAYELLHRQYPNSEWTAKTKYWYK